MHQIRVQCIVSQEDLSSGPTAMVPPKQKSALPAWHAANTISWENVFAQPSVNPTKVVCFQWVWKPTHRAVGTFCRGEREIIFQSCKHLCLRPGLAKALAHRHRELSKSSV